MLVTTCGTPLGSGRALRQVSLVGGVWPKREVAAAQQRANPIVKRRTVFMCVILSNGDVGDVLRLQAWTCLEYFHPSGRNIKFGVTFHGSSTVIAMAKSATGILGFPRFPVLLTLPFE